MSQDEEGGNEPIPEDKGTNRKSSRGKRSRTEGSSSTKTPGREIDEEGGTKKGNRNTKSKDSSKDSKEKESSRKKKSRVESRGGNSRNLEGATFSREKGQVRASRSQKDGEKKSNDAPNKLRGNEKNGGVADHIAGVRQVVVIEESSNPANDSNRTRNTSTFPPSREINDGVSTPLFSPSDELDGSPTNAMVPGDDGDKKQRRSKVSTTASSSAASTRGFSRGDTISEGSTPLSSASSVGPSRAGGTTSEADATSQSNSRVSKSKAHSNDKQRTVKGAKKSMGRAAATTEITRSSTLSISSNATANNTIICEEAGSATNTVAREQRGVNTTCVSADNNSTLEPMNDTHQKEGNVQETMPNLDSLAHAQQTGMIDFQDMQEELLLTSVPPATGGKRRPGREESSHDVRLYTRKRRSESIDGGGGHDKVVQPGSNETSGRVVVMPPPELGVEVIDKGTTKDFVLTTSERLVSTMVLNGATRQQRLIGEPKDHRYRTQDSDMDLDEVKGIRTFREHYTTAVSRENVESPFVSGVSPDFAEPEALEKLSKPSRGEYGRVSVPKLGAKDPTVLLSIATSSPSVVQPSSVSQSSCHPPPMSLGMREYTPPELTHVDEKLWDLSPASSPISPSQPGYGEGRTAKYVREQVSFHDTLPGNYSQQSSRLVSFRGDDNGDAPTAQSTVVGGDDSICNEVTKASAPAKKGGGKTVQKGNQEYFHPGRNLVAKNVPIELSGDVQNGRSQSKSRCQQELNFGEDLTTEATTFDDTGAGGDGPLLHFRSDFFRQFDDENCPALFFLRPNEGLVVTNVEGTGRLLVSLTGETGDGVLVDGAIVYDSAADFAHSATLTDHRFPYVEGHRYEFRVAPTQGVVRVATRGCDNSPQRESVGSCRKNRQQENLPRDETEPVSTSLKASFSIVSTYNATERLRSAEAMRLCPPPAVEASSCQRSKSPSLQGTESTTPSRPVGSLRSPFLHVQSSRCNSRPGRGRPLSPMLAPALRVANYTEVIANGSNCLSKLTQTPNQNVSPRAVQGCLPRGNNAEASVVEFIGEGRMSSRSMGPEMYDGGDRGSSSSLRSGYESRTGKEEGCHPAATQFPEIVRPGAGGAFCAVSDRPEQSYDNSGYFARDTPVDSKVHSLRNAQNMGPPLYAMEINPSVRGNEGWTKERHTAQLQWNPAWEGTILSPRAPSPGSESLPLIQRHTDGSQRSRVCEQGGQDHDRGTYLRPSYGHTSLPLDRRRSRVECENSLDHRTREDRLLLQPRVRPPGQYFTVPHGRELGRGEIINAGSCGFAPGGHRVMDRHSRPWEHVSGENGPPNRSLGQLGWTNRTNTRPIAEDSSPRCRRKPAENLKREFSMDLRDGFAAGIPGGDDERYREREIDDNTKSHPSSRRYSGITPLTDSLGPSPNELRLEPGAPCPSGPLPRDSKGRRVVIGGERFAPQHGYRYGNSTVHAGGTNACMRDETFGKRREEEQSRYNFSTIIKPERKGLPQHTQRAARKRSACARPRRNQQLNGKGMEHIGINSAGTRQSTTM